MSNIRIGLNKFKTYTELQQYTKNLVNNILSYNSVLNKGDEYFLFFSELLKRHPYYEEIKGCGIKQFITFKNFNNAIAIKVRRIDNSEDVFSWSKITKKYPKDNTRTNLNHACRLAISKQIYFYRILNDCSKCAFCGSNRKIQIDHYGIEFNDIVNNFIKDKKHPVKFDRCPNTLIKKFKKEDYHFEREFQEYHAEHAQLQALCQECNLKKNWIKLDKIKQERQKEEPLILNFD